MATTTSPLLGLPAEIRNTIYEMALTHDTPIYPMGHHYQGALTLTCGQIRAESLALYYACNSFVLDNFHYTCNYGGHTLSSVCCDRVQPRPADWIDAIGYRNLRHIKSLRLVDQRSSWTYDVTLTQDLIRKTLTAELDVERAGFCENFCNDEIPALPGSWIIGSKGPLTLLLQNLIDRKVQPGLSPQGIKKIVGLFLNDYEWYGKTEQELSYEQLWEERKREYSRRYDGFMAGCRASPLRGWRYGGNSWMLRG